MKRLSLILLITFASAKLIAQDFRKAAAEARNAYGNLDHLHAVMSINVFSSEEANTPDISQQADIKKAGSNYRYQFAGSDMLMNDKYLVLVNSDVKAISISKRDLKKEEQFNDPMKINLDTLMKYYSQVSYQGRDNNLDQYKLTMRTGSLVSTAFFFDISTKMLRKIYYRYREGQVVKIEFKVFDQHPAFTSNTFSEKNYLVASKGRWTTTDPYTGYNVSDLTGGKQ